MGNVIDVTHREFGAVPGTDCTEAFQKAIDAWTSRANETRGRFVIPSGTYFLKGGFDLGRVRGAEMVGSGSLRLVGQGAPTKHSCLAYIGPPGGTMFRYGGSQCSFRGISFYGRPEYKFEYGNSTPLCAGQLFENYPGRGVGSGKTKFESCTFRLADTGIHCSGEGNVDYWTYDTCSFRELDTAYLVTNRHSVGHVFAGETYLTSLGTAFYFMAGGSFRLDHAQLTDVAIYLRFPETESNFGIGINNATYSTGTLKYDNKQHTTPRIVFMPDPLGSGNRIVDFERIRMHRSVQKDNTTPLFRIGGDVFLHVQKFAHLRCDRPVLAMKGAHRKHAKAKFEKCYLLDWIAPVQHPGTYCHWSFSECFDGGNGLLPDHNYGWELGPPVPYSKEYTNEYE